MIHYNKVCCSKIDHFLFEHVDIYIYILVLYSYYCYYCRSLIHVQTWKVDEPPLQPNTKKNIAQIGRLGRAAFLKRIPVINQVENVPTFSPCKLFLLKCLYPHNPCLHVLSCRNHQLMQLVCRLSQPPGANCIIEAGGFDAFLGHAPFPFVDGSFRG